METSRLLSIKTNTINLLRLVCLLATFYLCSGCASMLRIDGPYEGKVIDAETKQPIEGAVVHGTWSRVHLGGAHEYYDSYEVLTDKNGEFKIPGKGFLMFSDVEDMSLTIFKAGYKQWTPNSWSGLKEGKWLNEEVVWRGNKGTFRLVRLSMTERQSRGVVLPSTQTNGQQRLLILERNKEMIEIGRPPNTIIPVE